MKNPQKAVERLSKEPVKIKEGSLFAIKRRDGSHINLDLNHFPERPYGSLFMFSPEEFARAVEVIKAYLKQEEQS